MKKKRIKKKKKNPSKARHDKCLPENTVEFMSCWPTTAGLGAYL